MQMMYIEFNSRTSSNNEEKIEAAIYYYVRDIQTKKEEEIKERWDKNK